MRDKYDFVVIGGGSAGLVAAKGAVGIGARVALVEADRPGGDCLWTGCVPSKALLAAAATAAAMRQAGRYGIESVEPRVDLGRVLAVVRQAQAVIEPHDSVHALEAAGVHVVQGRGRFTGPGRIDVDGRVLRFRAALLATGSRPIVPDVEGLASAGALTSDSVWALTVLPARLVVLGGGSIGCELGQAFQRLGARVTLIEAGNRLLPGEDASIGEVIAQCLADEGMDVRVSSTAVGVARSSTGVQVVVRDATGETMIEADEILVAVGRRPSSDDMGLERVGVDVDDGGRVVVDASLRTTGDHIWAAGDVTGAMPFTHVAAHHARIVVGNALLRTRRTVNYDRIHRVNFTDPEVARVGLDAAQARAKWGTRAVVQCFDYSTLDRAVATGQRVGFAELVGDRRGRLVGATIVGQAAGESIAEATAWITVGAKISKMSTTVHAYPTFTEGPSRAADEVIRARLFSGPLRRATGVVIGLLRWVDRPSRRGS
jgi:pyruvate/2-oxoglutarate dehydrogenase complex dihydrolipoamide dehydrogenase (E3) component